MIRVIVADDHHIVRQGIRSLLERSGDIEVIAEAADGQEAIDLATDLVPDVVVMDVGMPRLNGSEATARIVQQFPQIQVVILSMYSDETLVRETLRHGARGYLLKRAVTEELLIAIRAAYQGETYLSPAISQILLNDMIDPSLHPNRAGYDQLTPREREVLQLVAEGHTNNAIARLLQVSVKTVEKHRGSLMAKLDIHDVAGLTRLAIERGLIFVRRPDSNAE